MIEGMIKQASELIKQSFLKGYKTGFRDGYRKGIEKGIEEGIKQAQNKFYKWEGDEV